MSETTDKIKALPENDTGKHLLYWMSLAAVTFTVLHTLRNIQKGKGL